MNVFCDCQRQKKMVHPWTRITIVPPGTPKPGIEVCVPAISSAPLLVDCGFTVRDPVTVWDNNDWRNPDSPATAALMCTQSSVLATILAALLNSLWYYGSCPCGCLRQQWTKETWITCYSCCQLYTKPCSSHKFSPSNSRLWWYSLWPCGCLRQQWIKEPWITCYTCYQVYTKQCFGYKLSCSSSRRWLYGTWPLLGFCVLTKCHSVELYHVEYARQLSLLSALDTQHMTPDGFHTRCMWDSLNYILLILDHM